jgi:hypothetical protein
MTAQAQPILQLGSMETNSTLTSIVQQEYRALRPRATMPRLDIRFYHYAGLNSTIRLREDVCKIKLSDMLEHAPESVLRAIAHILLAKLYRHPIDRSHASRYRKWAASKNVAKQTHRVRQARGRKHLSGAQGVHYDLEEVFEVLNFRHFHGLMARPQLGWSKTPSRRLLGHYDEAHNAIIISRIFDHADVPRYAVEYLVFHEMLHLKHPVKLRGSRRCIHGPAFQADEREFAHLIEAQAFIKTL